VGIKQSRWVLVTGASGDIGAAMCECFHIAGYSVIGTDISESPLRTSLGGWLTSDLNRLGSDEAYAEEFWSQVEAITAGEGICALVNNAAVQIRGGVRDLSRSDWCTTIGVNLTAPFFLAQLFLDSLAKNHGSIVNVGSIHATQTKPGFVAYATSKGALVTLTRAMAVDLGNLVRVNAIAPAAVGTSMLGAGFEDDVEGLRRLADFHPVRRIALASEIADVVLFLCSGKAAFIHGECLNVTGGIDSCLYDPAGFPTS
jgi:NAD(P)-dependent dehydrogenase (short-subunit alcohol dehydrogenase family)